MSRDSVDRKIRADEAPTILRMKQAEFVKAVADALRRAFGQTDAAVKRTVLAAGCASGEARMARNRSGSEAARCSRRSAASTPSDEETPTVGDEGMELEERIASIVDASTLFGDLRDALLDRLRAMPKPWTVMSEAEQREMIDGAEQVSRHLITTAVRLIAANGRPTIPAALEQCTVKDGIKAVFTLSRHDPLRHELTDAVGKPVLIVVADASQYMGETAPANPDPDQPTLPAGDEEEKNVKAFRKRG